MYNPHYKNGFRCTFTLQCPNMVSQLTLSLLRDATVRGGIHYHDVCKVADSVTIAYNFYSTYFAIYRGTSIMVKSGYYGMRPIKGLLSNIPRDWEIIQAFFDHHSLTPTWIDCRGIRGVLDEETGTWNGAVGKVRNCNLVNKVISSSR